MEPIVHNDIDEDIFAWTQHPDKPVYNEQPGVQAQILTVAVYLRDVMDGHLTDELGHAYPMRDGKLAKGRNIGVDYEFVIRPSQGNDCIPKDATHVVWFNR